MVLDENKLYHYISCVTFLSVCYFELFVICQFMILIYLTTQNNEIYEITTTIIDFGCVYLCLIIYIIPCEETISVTRNVLYSQYFQRRASVVYLNFDYLNGRHQNVDCLKRPSLELMYAYKPIYAVNMFEMC